MTHISQIENHFIIEFEKLKEQKNISVELEKIRSFEHGLIKKITNEYHPLLEKGFGRTAEAIAMSHNLDTLIYLVGSAKLPTIETKSEK